jgi:hypothetical protein
LLTGTFTPLKGSSVRDCSRRWMPVQPFGSDGPSVLWRIGGKRGIHPLTGFAKDVGNVKYE